jgi:D-aminopeptidase
MGLARTGGIAHHGSGDYIIAFSTDSLSRIEHQPAQRLRTIAVLHDDAVSPLFLAVAEATEEAIVNSLFMSKDMTGHKGAKVQGLPVQRVVDILKSYKRLSK